MCIRDSGLSAFLALATIVAAIMDPYGNEAALKQMAEAGLTAFAMELMPRITRAQSMDVLSSQANLAGYRAVIEAAEEYGRALPMMMTAAGTVPAAKVFVMGVGVALSLIHISEPTRPLYISYAVFCLKKFFF